MNITRITAALGAAALTLTLAACGSDDADSPATGTDSGAVDSGSADIEAASLTMTDPWVKAAKKGMTAAFGTLVNGGDTDITVVAATSDISSTLELHETVQNDDGSMAMQPKGEGFTIPAGGKHELAPGGDHLMIMDLTRALKPGERITIRLELQGGSTTEIDATVKQFSGAEEEYQGGHMEMDDEAHEGSGS